MSRLLNTLLLFALLLAACAPNADRGPLTVDGGTVTVTPTPLPTLTPTETPTPPATPIQFPSEPSNKPTATTPLTETPTTPTAHPTPTETPTPPATPTHTEAPLTLTTLGIPVDQQPLFQGLLKHVHRELIDGQEVLTTSGFFWDGEQRHEAKYIIEQGTFDAHLEIHDDLTRPRTVKAYRLPENYKNMREDKLEIELVEVTLLWQGPERGFREAIDLSGAYDPDLTQIDKHPYLHIVHGDRPIRSIKDLPAEDERLTLLQSIRLEQAKAIRALQAIREKLQNGQAITAEDLSGSVFLRRLQQKLQTGKKITEDDLYILFSPKAVEKWDAGGGLSLLFELQEGKWVHLKSKADDQPKQTYDSLNIKLTPLWFYTLDEEGNRHEKAVAIILDADDIERYKANQDPLDLQGKFIIGENRYDVEVSPENTYWQVLYKQNNPSSPVPLLYAEGGDLEKVKTPEGRQELTDKMRQQGIDDETIEKILGASATSSPCRIIKQVSLSFGNIT